MMMGFMGKRGQRNRRVTNAEPRVADLLGIKGVLCGSRERLCIFAKSLGHLEAPLILHLTAVIQVNLADNHTIPCAGESRGTASIWSGDIA